MLKRLRVQNFMSLKDTTIDLSPLTVFIGPNAAGKSAAFKALVTLSKLLRQFPMQGPKGEFNLEPAVTFDRMVWQGNSGLTITFEVWFSGDADDDPGYTLELAKKARGWMVQREKFHLETAWHDSSETALEFPTERRGTLRFETPYRATLCNLVYPYRNDRESFPYISKFLAFSEKFGQVWRYRPSALDIADFWKYNQGEQGREHIPYVGENGIGLAPVLQGLQGQDRELFGKIEDDLRSSFPHIRFINFQNDRQGVRLAFTTERSQELVPAPQESDGVLLTTFLLWRLHTAKSSLMVCLEEPENGTHPYLLGERFNLLKRFASGENSPSDIQLLVSTHSPDLLTTLENSTDILDSIRIVEFDNEKGTVIHRLRDIDEAATLLQIFDNNLGELWWSGGIGAVPRLE